MLSRMNSKIILLPAFVLIILHLIVRTYGDFQSCPPPKCMDCTTAPSVANCTSDQNCSDGKLCCPSGCGNICQNPYTIKEKCPSVPVIQHLLDILPCLPLPLEAPCQNGLICCLANVLEIGIIKACVCPVFEIADPDDVCSPNNFNCWTSPQPNNGICKIRPDCPSGTNCYGSVGCPTNCSTC